MRAESANLDAAVARLASRQHGVVTRRQLRALGLSEAAIGRRAASGRLHRIHRGVYAVGHLALSRESRWMAAVLACGEGAVLSHRSAACLWRLLEPRGGPIDVSLPSDSGRGGRSGIHLHRRPSLGPGDVTRRRAIPVTTPARTIADLKGATPAAQLRRAIRQAEVLGLPTGLRAPRALTRSELEERFLALCRRHRLPLPEVNACLGALEVDFLWPAQRLVVETDGYRYHRGRAAFEDDRARDLRLRRMDHDVIRLSYRQVVEEPRYVAEVLKRAIASTRR